MDTIQLDRLKLYVKHHSIVERCMLRRNPKSVGIIDRWDGLREAEGWDVELKTSGSGVAVLEIK